MENFKAVSVIYLALLSFTCYVIIYTYPAGNWISGPFIIMVFGVPTLITHIGLCVFYYVKRKSNWVIWASGVFTALALINVAYYVYIH